MTISTQKNNPLIELHQAIDTYFNNEEVHSLCFALGIDYDSVQGEGKSAQVRELILGLGRQQRLPELISVLKEFRPTVAWPSPPADIDLPKALDEMERPKPTIQSNHYGDVIYGDKMGGDKVAGGKTVNYGAASGVTTVTTTSPQNQSASNYLMPAFAPLLNHISQQTPIAQRGHTVKKAMALQNEVSKGEEADDELVAELIEDIIEQEPSSGPLISDLFTQSDIAKSAGNITHFVLKRHQKKH